MKDILPYSGEPISDDFEGLLNQWWNAKYKYLHTHLTGHKVIEQREEVRNEKGLRKLHAFCIKRKYKRLRIVGVRI